MLSIVITERELRGGWPARYLSRLSHHASCQCWEGDLPGTIAKYLHVCFAQFAFAAAGTFLHPDELLKLILNFEFK